MALPRPTADRELLDDTSPPTLRDLQLGVLAAHDRGNGAPPERLSLVVVRHLPDLPGPGMTSKHVLRQGKAGATAPVAPEDEELFHPMAVLPSDGSRRHQGETDILRI